MIDDLKKYIDSYVKRKLKPYKGSFIESGLPFCSVEGREQVDYSKLIFEIINTSIVRKFPQTESEVELIKFLNLEILYMQSIKELVDLEHNIINEALAKLNILEEEILKIIGCIKDFDAEKIDYYLLFKDEIDSGGNVLLAIQNKIDTLSEDSLQGTVISHSAKMTNPACRYPKIKVYKESSNDGYLHTGNNEVEFDVHINATKLKVFKFLSLRFSGKSFLDFVENNDCSVFVEQFLVQKDRALMWINNFRKCVFSQDYRTHDLIKQVYFPLENSYHQLSVLQPSGLVFLLKNKIDLINHKSPESYYGKKARKDGKFFYSCFSSITNLTVTKHGGDHPKNISGLNNKYQSYYLLSSEPPQLKSRDIQFPSIDFFTQSFSYYRSKDLFLGLHTLFVNHQNNWQVRSERDEYYQVIFDRIVERMWLVRDVALDQFNPETSQLNKNQKVWLCAEHKEKRDTEEDWLDDMTEQITRYIFQGYEKILGKKAFMFSDEEFKHIHKIVDNHREALR